MKNTQWKKSESKCGIWLGAYRTGTKSGRIPLSGSNSGTTKSDSSHKTIYVECKRSKQYISTIKLWEKFLETDKIKKLINIITLPIIKNNKIISKTSDIWCFHNNDSETIYNQLKNNTNNKLSVHEWEGNYPSALTLYHSTISTWKNSILDRDKQVAHCALFGYNKVGFWVIIHKNDIIKWWELILISRLEREKFLKDEEEFKKQRELISTPPPLSEISS
jgi:hypothetical protein